MERYGHGGRGRRGASLVEVMVVLVVLLIGVFAVIRVFPLGFQYLRNGENKTLAGRLVAGMMEQVKSDAAHLPYSVAASYIAQVGGNTTTITEVAADPDDLSAAPDGNPYFSDVNKMRYIRGEAVKIGLPTPGQDPTRPGFHYLVKFGPIFIDPAQANSIDATLKVSSAPMIPGNNLVDSRGGTLSPILFRGALRSPRNYVLDPGARGTGAFFLVAPSAVARTYRIRFLLYQGEADDDNPANQVAHDEEILVAASAEWQWAVVPGVANGDQIAPDSEVVTRAFRRLDNNVDFSEDPYEFKLESTNIPANGATLTVANIGMLAFNPAGANYSEDSSTGERSFAAFIDYPVLDWHILRDDRQVPSVFADSAGAVPVRLTMSRLKRNGDINSDNTLYDGLFPAGADPSANRDLVILRLDTGGQLVGGNYDLRTTSDANADYWVRDDRGGTWDTGTLHVNTNRIARGTPIRALYKADGDWAVALRKAEIEYRAWVLNQQGRPPIQTVATDTDGNKRSGDPAVFGIEGTRIYFTGSELNKSVTLRLESWDNAGRRRRTAPMQVTIDTQEDDYAYVDIVRYLPANLQRWKVVDGAIRGVSVKVRVIWRERNDFRAPWRVQDLDSYLTQESLR